MSTATNIEQATPMSAREHALLNKVEITGRDRAARLVTALREARVRESFIALGLERLVRNTTSDLLSALRDEQLISSEQEAKISASLRGGARFFNRTIVDRLRIEQITDACEAAGIALTTQRSFMPVELTPAVSGPAALTVVVCRDSDRATAMSTFSGKFNVSIAYASERTIRSIYQACFAKTEQALLSAVRAFESEKGTVLDALGALLKHGSFLGASDISLRMVGKSGTMFIKLGGVWRRLIEFSENTHLRVVSALEQACEGNDGDQVGIFRDTTFNMKGSLGQMLVRELSSFTFRISIGKSVAEKTVVIRILDEGNEALDLETIGIVPQDLINLRLIANRRSGLFAIVGPTGSGKTTFSHAFLKDSIDPIATYVQTAERPVEYRIPNASQYSLDTRKDIGEALDQVRSGLMRNAPHVILLGEVRTPVEAGYALDFSNTGHLLLTTFHADSAPMGVRRWLSFDVDPVDLAAQLLGVMAMRIVDQLCQSCKVVEDRDEYIPWVTQARARGVADLYRRNPGGCPDCGYVGYRGRFAIYELLLNSEKVQQAIIAGASEPELRKVGVREGGSLYDSALKGLDGGLSGVEEVLRAMPASMGWQ